MVALSIFDNFELYCFDENCTTKDEERDCIDLLISKGEFTCDQMLEKYMATNQLEMCQYMLQKYTPVEIEDVIATAIVCKCDVAIFELLLSYLVDDDQQLIDPTQSDLFYVSLLFGNPQAFTRLLKRMKDTTFFSKISCENFDAFLNVSQNPRTCSDDDLMLYKQLVCSFRTFDLDNVKNPRTLIYAILEMNMSRAKRLIEKGVNVRFWADLALREAMKLRVHFHDVIKMLLTYGSKMNIVKRFFIN
jgi:hypothetical protein